MRIFITIFLLLGSCLFPLGIFDEQHSDDYTIASVICFIGLLIWLMIVGLTETNNQQISTVQYIDEEAERKHYEDKIAKYRSRYIFDNFSVISKYSGKVIQICNNDISKSDFLIYDDATIEYDALTNRVYCVVNGTQLFLIKSEGSLKELYRQARKESKVYGVLKASSGGNFQVLDKWNIPHYIRMEFFCNLAEVTTNEKCHVYIMKNEKNGFHKIGISNNPDYREKTLQSEEPEITLLRSKEFPSRKIAYAFEQALHKAYDKKRVRGEWFNLSNSEVEEVISSLY